MTLRSTRAKKAIENEEMDTYRNFAPLVTLSLATHSLPGSSPPKMNGIISTGSACSVSFQETMAMWHGLLHRMHSSRNPYCIYPLLLGRNRLWKAQLACASLRTPFPWFWKKYRRWSCTVTVLPQSGHAEASSSDVQASSQDFSKSNEGGGGQGGQGHSFAMDRD
ncbi:hypothetical protein IFM47457_08717 [Aspergillus lentulus]|nr:hypothetical protein IFM47457_08717 [Aspergillus lentulus]